MSNLPSRTPSLLTRAGTASALTLAAVGTTLAVPGAAPGAEAATPAKTALRIAAAKKGAPYVWGAQGPRSFDCSGLSQYAYKHAGKKLPRTAVAQYNRSRHIPKSQRRYGDLVFFHSGAGVYHVGLYAGKGRIWHAPRPGRSVRLERIWTSSVWYGRVS
ncbi:C40 family peptidase [Streptomyces sp. NPDC058045]|uniref:C40 family peptidase n=1 Tax=Streptomyces sp. NPDC058045 TaxID=3346311 RepID=UPI0036ED4E9C